MPAAGLLRGRAAVQAQLTHNKPLGKVSVRLCPAGPLQCPLTHTGNGEGPLDTGSLCLGGMC